MEGGFFLVFMAVVYFLPTIGAIGAKKRNTSAIFVLNLFLGWIIALVWAACKDAEVK